MIQSISIKGIAKKEKTIEVDWSDGKKVIFTSYGFVITALQIYILPQESVYSI